MESLTLPFEVNQIGPVLQSAGITDFKFYGNSDQVITWFVARTDLDGATGSGITWSRIVPPKLGREQFFGLMVAPAEPEFSGNFIVTPQPHRVFFTIMRAVYGDNYDPEHEVRRGKNVQIGQNTVIRNAIIGSNVAIGDNCSIGGPGFGHVTEPDGSVWRVPHIGRVVIEDGVTIGSNTCIDRGCLGNTVIGKGAQIDNLVHVAHNVEVGENTCIVAGSVIGGSAVIGGGAWIGINASVRNGITVGRGAIVGMHANVVKDVELGTTVVGNPARERES